MERRVFGSPQFSDIIFKKSISLLEKVLDFILDDQGVTQKYKEPDHHPQYKKKQLAKKVLKLGFYANEQTR